MGNRSFNRSRLTLAAGAMLVTLLAGCGTQGAIVPGMTAMTSQPLNAAEATTLAKAFPQIHKAVFAKLDHDGNKAIDEYEAGPNLSLKDFARADKNGNHKLS